MSWGKLLQPDLVLGGTVLDITPDLLVEHNLKGLVFDVDETLVPIGQMEASEELRQRIVELRQVATLWLVSNNVSETRIGNIAKSLELPYIFFAAKPFRRKLWRAVSAMDLPVAQVAMVGDRLFTDVLAGNRMGMFTVLVEPMVDPGESVRHSPVRSVEVWLSQVLGASLTANR
ncbi:YqeG family HAD IIIA-type phosphatase [Sodalinema gerasimenkoae]|uniref:YqeG family HAD IIIA-type phosphatase n=1 Tax=Sodalinema gerasimenkoae TaxID=2862348 RepID=UPI00135944D3|nr:YqeG family HAD IIIA-type phosphatase [Sodalinema gerasimenkoae]